MKIVIVARQTPIPISATLQFYQQMTEFFKKSASGIKDFDVQTCLLDDLIISVGDGMFKIYDTKNNKDLKDNDVIFLRGVNCADDMDIIAAINEYAHENKIKLIDEFNNIKHFSKLSHAVTFHHLGLPVARTLLVNDAFLRQKIDLKWDFPCVMKATNASHGEKNFIVKNIAEVAGWQKKYPRTRFVLQRFVPNIGDYRILIIGNEILVIGRSAVDGSHLNNTSRGGVARLVGVNELPKTVINQSKKAMKYLGMIIAGVDVIQDKNTHEYFFLEINPGPQLMTGAFTNEKSKLLGKYLKKIDSESQ